MVPEQLLHSVQLRREEVPSFKRYPFTLSAVRTPDTLRLHRGVTFLIGENGSGKFTLLEAIAVAWGLNPEGGSRHLGFGTRELLLSTWTDSWIDIPVDGDLYYEELQKRVKTSKVKEGAGKTMDVSGSFQ